MKPVPHRSGTSAVARWLAVELAHYRAEHDLSQRQLADRLGLHQSDVARMEGGRVTPSLHKLIRIIRGLDIELMIDIRPAGAEAGLPRKQARRQTALAIYGVEVLMATA